MFKIDSKILAASLVQSTLFIFFKRVPKICRENKRLTQ